MKERTLAEFVESYRHEFGGMMADVLTSDKRGAELAMRLRVNFRRIDDLLAQIYAEYQPAKEPAKEPTKPAASNGVAPKRATNEQAQPRAADVPPR